MSHQAVVYSLGCHALSHSVKAYAYAFFGHISTWINMRRTKSYVRRREGSATRAAFRSQAIALRLIVKAEDCPSDLSLAEDISHPAAISAMPGRVHPNFFKIEEAQRSTKTVEKFDSSYYLVFESVGPGFSTPI
jgi:hypothetical protein